MANTCAFAAKTGKIKCFHIDSRNYKGSDESYWKGYANAKSHAV